MTRKGLLIITIAALFISLSAWVGCSKVDHVDSAKAAGLTPADFPETTADPFKAMDGGVELTADEIKGRNTWLLWTGGNEGLWDWLAKYGYGTSDLLKLLDSRKRGSRFKETGLVNEPGFKTAAKPDQYGLWLDERVGQEPAGIDPKVYGKSSGIVGLRLFPNPEFNGQAQKKWDSARFYSDPNYYNDPKLVRPYIVGMACGFCHVSFHPLYPPADPENPDWKNLSANIGNQYFKPGKIFSSGMKEDSFVYQLLNSSPPGSLDTSFIATDNLNNPGTMNAIFNVGARLSVGVEEKMANGTLALPDEKELMKVPHILKDGSDSIGLLGALSRVYVNIGEFHEEWLTCFNPLVGGKPQHPFAIAKAQRNSVYWQTTQQRMGNLAKYFLKAAAPMHLEDAPGGKAYLAKDQALLSRGKLVFAEHCAECHSSKQPPATAAVNTPEYKEWMKNEVLKADFRENNFLSTDRRYPVTLIKTNAARAVATNGIKDHVWNDFSSDTYKNLPAVGDIEVYNPFDGTTGKFTLPGGGRGYYRVPPLVSLWSSAPFFHNNALGKYTGDPSVAGRMAAFDDAAGKLLWPAKRLDKGSIWRTTAESWLEIPAPYLPGFLQPLAENGFLKIGPIPAGTPINLLANADLEINDPAKIAELVKVATKVKHDLLRIRLEKLDANQSRELLKNLVPDLLKISKCPDFIEDRGHYFGTELPDGDKRALVEFLKTL